MKRESLATRAKRLWNFFTTYEKIWFFSILILAVIFTFVFPETDDPTYTVRLTVPDSSGESAEMLDFTGIEDDFVLTGFTIGSEEYSLYDYLKVDEFTVSPAYAETLTVKLPVPVKAGETIEVECYPDGEGETLTVALQSQAAATLGSFTFDLGDENDASISKNAPKYLVSVGVIMFLYLADTVTNIACELLISKQSKWNFMVSLLVEIIEIIICIVCVYRFATLATTIFFWIPCDIISFIMWNKNPDKEEKELTVVKALTPAQDVLVVIGIAVWTVVVGYLLTFIDTPAGIFANNIALKNIACYFDACASAVGIANGLFILFRYREQWIAWYICSIIETVINIMAGQWVLLVLKAGYLTNTTYGYIKWTKYINAHKDTADGGKKPKPVNA